MLRMQGPVHAHLWHPWWWSGKGCLCQEEEVLGDNKGGDSITYDHMRKVEIRRP